MSNDEQKNAMMKIPRIPGNRHGCDLLMAAMKPEFAQVLPRAIRPEVLIRCAITAIQQNPGLFECSSRSLAGALIQCAQLGLLPDSTLGHAYLIPFRNGKTGGREAQLQIGYKGLIYLAARSEAISHVDVDVVYEDDEFKFAKGTNAFIEHIPAKGRGQKNPKDIVYVYAIATLPNGRTKFDLMERDEIEAIRKAAPSARAKRTPWDTHWEEMAKKTVLRRLCKTIPNAPLTQAANLDEMAAAGISQGLAARVVATNPELDKALGEPDMDPMNDAADDNIAEPEEKAPPPKPKSGKKSGKKARAKTEDVKPKATKSDIPKSSEARFDRLLEVGAANKWSEPDIHEYLEDAEVQNLDGMTEDFFTSFCEYVRTHTPEGTSV